MNTYNVASCDIQVTADNGDGSYDIYGLLAMGAMDPGVDVQFEWDHSLYGISNGPQRSLIYLAHVNGDGGDDLSDDLFGIPGTFADPDTGSTLSGVLLIGGADAQIGSVLIGDDFPAIFDLSDFAGATFTPDTYRFYLSSDAIDAVPLDPVAIPNSGLLDIIGISAASGGYYLLGTVHDIWGNDESTVYHAVLPGHG